MHKFTTYYFSVQHLATKYKVIAVKICRPYTAPIFGCNPGRSTYNNTLNKKDKRPIRIQLRISLLSSRGDRIRTCDHLVPNQVRYRTALRPDSLRSHKCIVFFSFLQIIITVSLSALHFYDLCYKKSTSSMCFCGV